jgi:hypothetical protein
MELIKVNQDLIAKFPYPGDVYDLYDSIRSKLDVLFSRGNHWIRMDDGVSTYKDQEFPEQGTGLHHWPELRPFLDCVWPSVKEYARLVDLDPERCEIRTMWANIYHPGGRVNRHRHFYTDKLPTFSLICYLVRPPESGNLFVSVPGEDDVVVKEIDYAEGDIVIFPSRRLHWSGPNLSDQDRVLIAFDWYQTPSG